MKRIALLLSLMILLTACKNSKTATDKPDILANNPSVREVNIRHEVQSQNKRELLYFLWLGCPHCKDFYALYKGIPKKYESILNVRGIPVAPESSPIWTFDAKVYLVLAEMSLADKLSSAYYEARQVTDREVLGSQDEVQVAQWLKEKHGVNEADFLSLFHSSLIEQKLAESRELTSKYEITGTPSVVVALPESAKAYVITTPREGGVAEQAQLVEAAITKDIR